jgi:FKBP-type peptidyl-prolyl cis-trans isomerase
MKPFARLLIAAAVLLLPAALHAQREKLPPADLAIVEKKWPEAKKTATGLRYVMLQEGTGVGPKVGDNIRVLYKGMLMDGTVFDEEADRNRGLLFRLGRGLVIEGWDQGLKLLKPGGKILLIIPPSLAYGTRGDPPKIPGNTSLVFEVELLEVNPPPPTRPPPASIRKQ